MTILARWLSPRRALFPAAGLLIVFSFAMPEFASADSNVDTRSVQDTTAQQQGTASGGGVAGPAVAFSQPIVSQMSIQVDASGCEETNTQDASNDEVIDQMTLAMSGDASGTEGGTAVSGPATAGSIAVVTQLNIQVIAGPGACNVTQEAGNAAGVSQSTGAVSGDASAAGSGSTSRSGAASAMSVATVHQQNVQVAVGTGIAEQADAITQRALNGASISQTTSGQSGGTYSTDDSDSTSGDVRSRTEAYVQQLQLSMK